MEPQRRSEIGRSRGSHEVNQTPTTKQKEQGTWLQQFLLAQPVGSVNGQTYWRPRKVKVEVDGAGRVADAVGMPPVIILLVRAV